MYKKRIVKKYGGASLKSTDLMKDIAKSLKKNQGEGQALVIVVSAMGQTTNELLQKAKEISQHPPRRELDMLLTSGERISMALMSMALYEEGLKALSLTGSQSGIITTESHQNAAVIDVRPERIEKALADDYIVVVAGYQGVSKEQKEITTLGRGGSDTTAVALAAALGAEHVEILKEVDGVYNIDPNLVHPQLKESSEVIKEISLHHLYDMTLLGAKVLHHESVLYALKQGVKIFIGSRAAETKGLGTWALPDLAPKLNGQSRLAINSQNKVLWLGSHSLEPKDLAEVFWHFLKDEDLPNFNFLPILDSYFLKDEKLKSQWLLPAPAEWVDMILEKWQKQKASAWELKSFALVSATFCESPDQVFSDLKQQQLTKSNAALAGLYKTAYSICLLCPPEKKHEAVDILLSLTANPS